jgi:hypothetical protein
MLHALPLLAIMFVACGESEPSPQERDAGVDAMAPLDASRSHDASRADAVATPVDAAAAVDAAPCDPFVAAPDCASTELPNELRCTGLYGDWSTRGLACGVREYKPAYELWSDGAEKHRFVSLPAGQKIDATDPNGFAYPIGTQFWKEFRVGSRRAETRLLRKTQGGWLYTSYVWSEDGATATRNDEGVADLYATGHAVPTHEQCRECHAGRPDFVLGWDWIMLGHGAEGVTRDMIDAIAPNRDATAAAIPGDDIERAALGYLHANCGVSCHNGTSGAMAHEIAFQSRLELGELSRVQATDVVRTGVNATPNWWSTLFVWGAGPSGGFLNLRPGDPDRSYALARMSVRGGDRQMPRIATARVDAEGVRIVRTWIEHMTVERGYPAPAP